MKPATRQSARLSAVLGGLALLGLLLAGLDGRWLRPAVVHYLAQHSHRQVQIDELHLGLDAQWQPMVTLRGLRIANAPWAGPRPLIVAREARFTFDRASLFGPSRTITQMALVDADIDLQRQADGLRNWRLTRPDDRGPARMRVLRLQAERSRLTLQHHGLGLVLQASSTAAPASSPGAQQVAFEGEYRGARFQGRALGGPVLSMVDTGEFFPLQGEVQAGGTQLAFDGRIADLLQLAALDGRVQVQGRSLADLQAYTPHAAWPASRPYRFEGRLGKRGLTWTADDAQLLLGRSELAGRARYTRADDHTRGARTTLQATVHSRRLQLADVPAAGPAASAPGATPRGATRVLPQAALPLQGLARLDGVLDLTVDELQGRGLPATRAVQAHATLERGLLAVTLQQAELAGGRVAGRLALDTRAATPQVQLALQGQQLQLAALWPPLRHREGVDWPALQGEVQLAGSGASVAAWAASASGRIHLSLQGGSLSQALEARLGLNAGGMLRAVFKGGRAVPIRCGALSLALDQGQGRTRTLVLDTERTRLDGQGSLHLGDETWALVLTPEPHGAALTLPGSVLAQGNLRGMRYSLAERMPVTQAERSACDRSD